MLYMVQLRYRADQRDALRRRCEQSGVTGFADGATLNGAWVSARRHAFLLFDAADEDCVQQICSDLSRHGEVERQPVISIDQIL